MNFPPTGDQWEKRFPTNTDMLAEFGIEGQFDEDVASYTYNFLAPQTDTRLSVTFKYPHSFIHVTMWISDQEVIDIDMEDVDSIRIARERGSTYLAVTFIEKRYLRNCGLPWNSISRSDGVHSIIRSVPAPPTPAPRPPAVSSAA